MVLQGERGCLRNGCETQVKIHVRWAVTAVKAIARQGMPKRKQNTFDPGDAGMLLPVAAHDILLATGSKGENSAGIGLSVFLAYISLVLSVSFIYYTLHIIHNLLVT